MSGWERLGVRPGMTPARVALRQEAARAVRAQQVGWTIEDQRRVAIAALEVLAGVK